MVLAIAAGGGGICGGRGARGVLARFGVGLSGFWSSREAGERARAGEAVERNINGEEAKGERERGRQVVCV